MRDRSSLLVAGARAAILVAVAAAALSAWRLGRSEDAASPGGYVCPMHPDVQAPGPGDCPICGMALERAGARARTKRDDDDGRAALASTFVSAEAANLVRYSMGPARRHVLPGEVYAPAIVGEDGRAAADLYADEVASLRADERASFVASTAPSVELPIRRSDQPPTSWDRATARVAFEAVPGAPPLPAGAVGWVKLAYQARDMLVVPSSAVLESPAGSYVLVYSLDRRTVQKRTVSIGKAFQGLTVVTSGLREKEIVVVMNAFFLEAERRLRAGDGP